MKTQCMLILMVNIVKSVNKGNSDERTPCARGDDLYLPHVINNDNSLIRVPTGNPE